MDENSPEYKISDGLRSLVQANEDVIEEMAGEKMGFFILVVPFNRTGTRASFASNMRREDSVREMKKMLELWGEGMPDIPAHEVH